MEEKKHRSVRIKDKDMKLFNFLSMFGFATVDQLHGYLGGSINSLKTRLSHLVNDGYLLNHRIFYGKPSVYTVTRKGSCPGLSVVKEISVGKYEHDLLVIDVFLKLKEKFSEYSTERVIRNERGVGIGKSGRIPDLKATTKDKKTVAIEVDRTDKGLDRLRLIIASYAFNSEINEIWFICSNKLIFNNLEKVNFSDKVKIFHLKDVLAGNELIYNSASKNIDNGIIPNELKQFFTENKINQTDILANEESKNSETLKPPVSSENKPTIKQRLFSNADDILKRFLGED